jgi:hypothetical protein
MQSRLGVAAVLRLVWATPVVVASNDGGAGILNEGSRP